MSVFDDYKHIPHCENPSYSCDDAGWHAANPPLRPMLEPTKRLVFEIIQEDFSEEFQQLRDFLDGKTEIPEGTDYKWACRSIKYLESPETFEQEIAALDELHGGDLSTTDHAWIANTRVLITKYHAIVCALEDEYQKNIKEETSANV